MPRDLVILLRGINVGAHKRMKMAELRELLQDAGFTDVRTLLQSGNVVAKSTLDERAATTAVERAIKERLGFDVDVVVRTGEELEAIVAADPFGEEATDPKRYVVLFLTREADEGALQAIREKDFSPEEFRGEGRELYVWCPDGLQKSPLNVALAHRRVAPVVTARNWSTVLKLRDMVLAAR